MSGFVYDSFSRSLCRWAFAILEAVKFTFLAMVRSIPSFLAIGLLSADFSALDFESNGEKTALFQSVITHYDTFIHSGCKVPWALRGGPGSAASAEALTGNMWLAV